MNFINTTSTPTDHLPISQWAWPLRSIIVLTICGTITILTILGNGLVLISVKLRFHARSYSDYFIVSLCLADFFVGLFVMPFMTMHSIHSRWPFHYRLCYIWMSIDFTCSTASFLTLASMALDRYYALTTPYFHLRNRSYSSVLIFIISSWAIPFAIWPCSIFLAHQFSSTKPACVHPANPLIIVVLCICFYYIPLLFMLGCYSRIIANIKNIESMIKNTWCTYKFDSIDEDCKSATTASKDYGRIGSHDKNNNTITASLLSAQSNSTLCSYVLRYFQRNSSKESSQNSATPRSEGLYFTQNIPVNCQIRRVTLVNQGMITNTTLPGIGQRPNRQTTTATFTGQKRCLNDLAEDNRSKPDLLIGQDDDQFYRPRLSSRTSSLPAARCISYYNYQSPIPVQTRMIDDQHHSRLNSLANERSRSQSHSSSQGNGNGGLAALDASDHSSSFENGLDDEHRRLNRRHQPAILSTSYNSSRFSQRAVAKFMHERNKARLRRNQKASRMLGILLAVFLICWLPFTISYPAMIFYHNGFPPQLESIIFWFGYVNSLLNPFLYVYSSRNFRQAVIETLCCFARLRSKKNLRYQWSLRD
ncbi:unnamed protein product [Rotaria socialis]|uniref:G-protein coupled receptors family 1 profile domain-containing protein n=1 Tax=Rotaria socialis TaxID=392032 RepID=A0A820VAA0_9BILA|nr:unnamed protein product [Rotaria socialis]CAF3383302.1 unnamed protein product [Rotaria socialis]CAF3560466.1 unnamed protein product [Rotaria socialis]CAF3699959.1 unnamed protein product [Rotaria socialis]CAF4130339.1 unnamed protein product [Rotaria socialis]